jgi:hypothetical protein
VQHRKHDVNRGQWGTCKVSDHGRITSSPKCDSGAVRVDLGHVIAIEHQPVEVNLNLHPPAIVGDSNGHSLVAFGI